MGWISRYGSDCYINASMFHHDLLAISVSDGVSFAEGNAFGIIHSNATISTATTAS